MLEILLGVWQFLLVFGLGLLIFDRIQFSSPYGYRLAIAFGLGFAGFSFFYFGLGLIGGLRPTVLIPISALLTPVVVWRLWMESGLLWRTVREAARESPFAFVLMSALFLFYLLGACVPEREEDAIWYHLGVPIYYLFHGGIIQEVPYHLPSHYPMYGQLHYTLSLAAGNDSTAKAFSVFQFLPILILIHSVLRRFGHSAVATYGCVLFLCCVHFRLPAMANVQRTVFFFALLSTVLLWEALDRKSLKTLLLAGFFCGMAMGTKLNALLFVFGLQSVLILGWALWVRPGWRTILSFFISHSVVSWVVDSPWLIKSYLMTGNPFYPMLSGWIGVEPRFYEAARTATDLHGLTFLKVDSIRGVWDQILHNFGTLMSETDLISILGPLCLAILPLIAPRRNAWILSSSAIVYLFLTQVWGNTVGRIFAINSGLLVLLITATLSEISSLLGRNLEGRSIPLTPIVAVLFVASFVYAQSKTLLSDHIDWYGRPILGEENRRDSLRRRGLCFPHRLPEFLEKEIRRQRSLLRRATQCLVGTGDCQ